MFSSNTNSGGFGSFGSPNKAGPFSTSFGGSTPAPTTFGTTNTAGFGSFGGANNTTTNAPTFGSTLQSSPFGKPASTGFGTSFGTTSAFGSAPATAVPTFGSANPTTFGSNSTTPMFGSNTATTSSFGSTLPSFGSTMTAPSSTSTFGSTPSFSSFGTTSNLSFGNVSKPTTFSTGFGGGFGGGLGVPSAAPVEEISQDTKYNDLPHHYKAEIDAIYKDYKIPMRSNLNQIKRFEGATIGEWQNKLELLRLIVVNIETTQLEIQSKIKNLLEEIKPMYREFKSSSTTGMSQIKSRGGGVGGGRAVLLDEELPDRLYLNIADNLERRLLNCLSTIKYFEKQLIARANVVNSTYGTSLGSNAVGMKGPYGQTLKVGPKQLLLLLKQQAEVFSQIASEVAAIHQATNALRQYYVKNVNRSNTNPFEAANRQDTLKQIEMEEKLKQESLRLTKNRSKVVQPSSTTTGAPATNFGFGSGLNTPAPNTSTTPSLGFGSIPAAPASFGTSSSFTPSTFGAAPSTAAPASSTSFAALDLATSGSTLGQSFTGGNFGGSFGGFATSGTNPATRKTKKK